MSSAVAYVIGVDGGASKTRAVIASEDGSVVVRRHAPGSAIVGAPHAEAIAVLRALLEDLADDVRAPLASVRRVVLGLSGVDFVDEIPGQARDLAEALGLEPQRLALVNDSIVALAGASSAPRSTIVQHGTEVTLAFRGALGAETVFDSLGVADCFDLRHRAIPLVARMIDGRAPPTGLRDAVLAHCGAPAEGFAEWVLRSPNATVAILTLAPVVFDCWAAGDKAAAGLVRNAVEDYVVATAAMARRIGPGPFDACFGGGVISLGGSALLEAIARRLTEVCPQGRATAPAHAPEIGAVSLALHGLGLPAIAFPDLDEALDPIRRETF